MSLPTQFIAMSYGPKQHKKIGRIEEFEVKLTRPLSGYTVDDHHRNKDIRSAMNGCCVAELANIYRNNWYENILRVSNTSKRQP